MEFSSESIDGAPKTPPRRLCPRHRVCNPQEMRPSAAHAHQMDAKSWDMTPESLGFIFESTPQESATNCKNVLRLIMVTPVCHSCYEGTGPRGFGFPMEIERAPAAELAVIGDRTSG